MGIITSREIFYKYCSTVEIMGCNVNTDEYTLSVWKNDTDN